MSALRRERIDALQSNGLKATLPRIRVLRVFQDAPRRHFEGDKAVFDLAGTEHHDHLVCLHCGRVEEFVDTEIERRQQAIARERGFELEDHALELYGRGADPARPSGR